MGEKNKLVVFADKPEHALGDMFGIFFEDLNHAADGGLYAELVQNRSFEFDPIDNKEYHALTAWEKVERGNASVLLSVEKEDPLNQENVHYLCLEVIGSDGCAGVSNIGFNSGIPVEKGETYFFSFYARNDSESFKTMTVALENKDGNHIYASEEIKLASTEWSKYEVTFHVNETDYSSRLVLTTTQQGKIYIDMVSLFPTSTYKGRRNGLRKDIAEKLEELRPKFMRFPGGCLVHDGSLNENDRNSMYRWKKTLGKVEERPARRSNWGYNQTLGLGYYEYFQFSEDIGAKSIPILPAGYDPHHQRIVPLDELQPWIDEALDLIEFANGDTSTEWGAIRAELGHPEPFKLEYIGIGNEEVGEPFFERYDYFHRAIKEKYPEINIINSSGPFAAGSEYERGWDSAKRNHSDFVDEHYYQSPEWFLANYDRYDEFKQNDPKVFLGEYASWGNTYYNALVEAAFMTGLEKNAHAVGLACYAPLLCNVDYVNWKPDLIWFDNHRVFGTANYYVQKLFMNHQGDQTVKVEFDGESSPNETEVQPIIGRVLVGSGPNAIHYDEIKMKNLDTGEERFFDGCIVKDHGELDLDEVNWRNYQISLKAKKTAGTQGFKIYFGSQNEQNRLIWEIGGWQNQDSIIGANVNGRNSCLTQSLFTVEIDREYELKLEVRGRHIRTFIDGDFIDEAEDKLPVIKPLYYSASIEEETGDIIVKVVNVKDIPVETDLEFNGLKKEANQITIYQMSGNSLEDENSFEETEKIVPKIESSSLDGSEMTYEFPKHSITVIRIK